MVSMLITPKLPKLENNKVNPKREQRLLLTKTQKNSKMEALEFMVYSMLK